MVFITTTMGYFAAVITLQPALLEQEKIPKPTPEQIQRNFASLGRDPSKSAWDRYIEWLTNVVTKFDWGRSPNGAYVILDEAQNTTPEQMKMFLTRIGFGAKAVITGDISQIDLPRNIKSGLKDAREKLRDVEGLYFHTFTSEDVVRHPLVQKIVDAYDDYETAQIAKQERAEQGKRA